MSKARDLGDLLNTDGDVKSDSLDMVPIPTKATIEALGIDVPAANLTGTLANARFPTTLSKVSLANGSVYDNLNTISGNTTTTTSSTKNMFLLGQISVNDTYTWTIAGDGVLQII
jgi:hypothetical protein